MENIYQDRNTASKKMSSLKPITYIPQLDALRAVAVILVIISHWIPKDNIINFYPIGPYGVIIFFVLSGFLITTILIRNRNGLDNNNGKILSRFYIRRFLRIFPLYYLIIFIAYLINHHGIQDRFAWYLLYGSNFLMFFRNSWDESFSHLWTLAVEEQFYLIWPFVILFTPNKFFNSSILIFIFFSLVTKILVFHFYPGHYYRLITSSVFDSFGFGALLAVNYSKIVISKVALVSIIIVLILPFTPLKNNYPIYAVIHDLALSYAIVWLIHRTSIGFSGSLGKVFCNPLLRYLGKISYGLYIIHPFVPELYKCLYLWSVRNKWFFPFSNHHPLFPLVTPYVMFFVYFFITVVIASTTWFFFERPINGLKEKFSYQ